MGNITTIGIDLAKHVFSTCELDAAGRVRHRQDLTRTTLATWLARLPPGTIVAMEACSSAHHWARRAADLGLQPRLMAAQFVTPFRKSQTRKNDRNDAEAIATAARQGNMRFVAIKSVDQQARLAWHRVRESYKAEALAIGNRIRGLLAEFGVAVAKRDGALRAMLGDQARREHLPTMLLDALDGLAGHWQQVHERLAECDRRVVAHALADARSRRAQQLSGVGPLTADALVAAIGNGREFANGRQLAAWLGLVPTQHSSGGKAHLGSMSCRGDAYLRTLLIQGARSSHQRAMATAPEQANAEQVWIRSLASRMPFGKLLVAIANKHARQLWAILARDQDYDPDAWMHHPMVQRPARAVAA